MRPSTLPTLGQILGPPAAFWSAVDAEVDEALGTTPVALRPHSHRKVRAELDPILDDDPLTVLTSAWKKFRVLQDAGRATLDDPDAEAFPRLAGASIEATQTWKLAIIVDGVPLRTSIDVALVVDADLVGVEGVVRRGRLVALRSGHLDLTVTLEVGPTTHRGKRTHPLPERGLDLGSGVALVRGA